MARVTIESNTLLESRIIEEYQPWVERLAEAFEQELSKRAMSEAEPILPVDQPRRDVDSERAR